MTRRNQIVVEAESPPSAYAISDLVQRKPGAVGRTFVLTLQRSLLIAPGLYVAGLRGRRLLIGSVYASVGVTLALAILYSFKKQ